MNVAIGKASIKRAVNAGVVTKEENITIKTTQTKDKTNKKEMDSEETKRDKAKQQTEVKVDSSKQVISSIKSDLPIYLL